MLYGLGLALAAVAAAAYWPDDSSDPGPPSGNVLRAQAMALCDMYLGGAGCFRGDAHYLEICKDFGGSGTTCGYLPAWMLDRLGCRDPGLVNRADAAAGLVYRVGMNLSDLVNGGKTDGIWRIYSPDNPPEPGDILYFGVVGAGGGITKEHVAVCKSFPAGGQGDLVTYDLGHSIQPEGSLTTRHIGPGGVVDFLGGQKTLVGIDDLSQVPITAPADLTDHTLAVA